MNKNEQMQVNTDILKSIESINEEITQNVDYVSRLRTCSAWIYETENWYILKSYNTKIAAIHKHKSMY